MELANIALHIQSTFHRAVNAREQVKCAPTLIMVSQMKFNDTFSGWLIQRPDGSLMGRVNSWTDSVPLPFKNKSSAEKYDYLGKLVEVTLVIKLKSE